MTRSAIDLTVAAEKLEGWAPTPDDIAVLESVCNGEDPLGSMLPPVIVSRPRLLRRQGYLYPGTSLLRNRFAITDPQELARVEYLASAVRLCEIHCGRVEIGQQHGSHRLMQIHRHLFGDLYRWAGRVRTVNISKGGTPFAAVPDIWSSLHLIDRFIDKTAWADLDAGELSYAVAVVYAELNHAHPFREGNGRAATMLLHCLTGVTAWTLDLGTVSAAAWIDASRDSSPFRRGGRPSPRPFVPIFRRALKVS